MCCGVACHSPPRRVSRAGVPYPRLEEALDLMRGRVPAFVELKTVHDVVARAVDLSSPDDVLLSFQRPPLEQARALRPTLRTVQHVEHARDASQYRRRDRG